MLQSRQHQSAGADELDSIVGQRQRPQRRQPRQPRLRQSLDGVAVQIEGLQALQRLEDGPTERDDAIVAQVSVQHEQKIDEDVFILSDSGYLHNF